MSEILNKQDQQNRMRLSQEDINTLVQAGIIPEGTPTPQIYLFAKICEQHGLSPFSKEIHLVPYWNKDKQNHDYTSIIGVDGYRNRAASSGRYAGMSQPMYNRLPDGSFKTAAQLIEAKQRPITCAVIAYAIIGGNKVSFDSGDILFSEFNTGKKKWRTMPFHMIEKVAKTFALREGFPRETAGLHTIAEMGAFEDAQVPDSANHVPITPQGQKSPPQQSNENIDLKEVEKLCKLIYESDIDPWTKNTKLSTLIREKLDEWFKNNDAAAIGKKYRRLIADQQKEELDKINLEELQNEIDNIFASGKSIEEKEKELSDLILVTRSIQYHPEAKKMVELAFADLKKRC